MKNREDIRKHHVSKKTYFNWKTYFKSYARSSSNNLDKIGATKFLKRRLTKQLMKKLNQ